MARNSYNVENGFNIEGINENLLSKGVKGNLPIEEFKQLIAEIKEFSKAADEARASYEKMIAEGLKPTRDQLKEIKKYRGQSDRLAKAQLQADASIKNAGTKGRAAMAQKLSKELGRASDSAHGRVSYGNKFALNKEKGYAEKNQEDYLRSQQDSKEMFLKNNPRVARRLNGVTGFKGTKYILNNNKSEAPKAQEQQPLTQQADSAEKDAERIVKATEEVKKAEESTVSQKTSTDTPLAQEATVAEKSAEQIVKASEEAKKAEQSVTEAKTQASTGNQGISNVDFMKNLREMYPGWNKESSNTTNVPINVGNEQPKGEILPKSEVEQQTESILSTVQSTKEEILAQVNETWTKLTLARQAYNKAVNSGDEEKARETSEQISKLKEEYDALTKKEAQLTSNSSTNNQNMTLEEKRAQDLERRKALAEQSGTYHTNQMVGDKQTWTKPGEFFSTSSKLGKMSMKELEEEYKKREANGEETKFLGNYIEFMKKLQEKQGAGTQQKKVPSKAKETKQPTATDSGKALDGVANSTKNVQSEAGKTTSSLKNLDKELKQKKTDSEGASSGFAQFGEVLKNTISTISKVAQTIGKIGGTVWHGFKAGIDGVISGVKTLASGLHSLVSGGFNLLKSAVSTTLGNMQKLVSGGFNAVKNGISAVKKGFENVKNTMTSLVKKGTPNLMKSFSSIKSMLMRRIKRTFISSIFNQAKEGLQQLAKSSRDFDQSMSNIKNTSKQVAGNLAITLGNLIQTIEPVLTTLLGWLNKVFEAINGLFAMISGKKTMLVAKKNTDQYSKSLKNASGSAKDLNHQLYGFDEITRQEDNSSSGGGGKIGYESAEIGDRLGSISDFFKNMLIAFKNGQFEKVGSLVAEQLNNLVEKVDKVITDITPKAKQWATNIARILNGMLLSPKLFENLGKLLGDGINLAFGVVNNFLKTFDFKKLGSRIGLVIKKAFKTIKWRVVGEAIANYFNMLPRFLAGLFEELNWSEMGDKIATGIASFFRNIDWQARQDAISNGINGIVTFLTKVITGVNWANFATTLGNHIKDTVNAIHWSDISNLLSTGANKLFDAFGNLVDTHFFSDLFGNIGKMLGDALAGIDWSKLAADIVTGLAELRSAFWSLIGNLDLPNLATKIADGINSLLTDDKVKKAWDDSHQKAVDGLGQIVDAFSEFVSRLKLEEIMGELGTKVGDLFKSVNWVQLGNTVRDGLRKAIRAFGEFVKNLDLPTIAKEVGEGVRAIFAPDNAGRTIFDDAIELVTTGLGSIVDAFGNLVDEIFKTEIIDGKEVNIGTKIADAFAKLFSSQEGEDTLFQKIGKTVGKAFSGVVKNIVSFIDEGGLAEMAGGLLDMIKEAINGVFASPDGVMSGKNAEQVGEAISNGIKDVIAKINDFLTQTDFEAMGESIGKALGSIDWLGIAKSIVVFLWNALVATVKSVGGLVGSFIRKLFGIEDREIFDTAGNEWAQSLADSVRSGLGDGNVQQKTALAAATYATGLADSFLGELDVQRDNITKKAEHVAHEAINAIATYFNEEAPDENDLMDAANSLAEALNIPFDTAYKLMQNSELKKLTFEDLMSGIYDAKNTQEVIDFFKKKGIDISEALASSLVGASPRINDAAQYLVTNLHNAKTFEEAKAYFAEAGIEVGDEFASTIAGESLENISAALMLLGMGVDEATILAMDTSHLSENLNTYMKDSGKTLEEIAVELGGQVGDGIGFTIPDAIAKALGLGTKEVQRVKGEMVKEATVSSNEVAESTSKASKLGSSTTSAIAKATEEGKTEVDTATEKVTSGVEDAYEKLPDEVKPYAEQVITYVCEALSDKNGTVHAAIEKVAQDAVDRAKEILNGPAGLEIATTFLNGIRDGIKTNNNVVNYVISVANDAVNGASAKMNYANGYRIGQNMITGLYNGFHSYSQKLVDFVKEVCQACIDMTQQVFKWGSPSKVFMHIGEYVMEGMQIGLESQSWNVVDTVAEVTNAITEAGEEASLENIMGDGLDNVATKLERIVDIFSDMADVIASMGGLEIPTVAAGKTIPYSTQMGGSTFGGNLANGRIDENAIENAFYSAITRAMDNSNGTQNINVYLDGRQIADSVTKYQRRNARAMGV